MDISLKGTINMKSILRRFAVLILSLGMMLLCGCEITTAQGGKVVEAQVNTGDKESAIKSQ